MVASAKALVLFVPVASDAPASSGARASPEGRDWRGRKMEETMQLLTVNQLWRLTRIALSILARRIKIALPALPDGSPERANALASLRNISYVLLRRDFSP